MVGRAYVPDAGDLIWIDFDPQTGHEQKGRRPGLVLSPRAYNQRSQLALVCPVTSRAKGYPFEVPLPAGARVTGVVLADHVKNLDWKARQATFETRLADIVLEEVRAKLLPLLGA